MALSETQKGLALPFLHFPDFFCKASAEILEGAEGLVLHGYITLSSILEENAELGSQV